MQFVNVVYVVFLVAAAFKHDVSAARTTARQTRRPSPAVTAATTASRRPTTSARTNGTRRNESFVRDCSDAPDKDSHGTCLMMRNMDRVTRERFRRQQKLQGVAFRGARQAVWQQAVPLAPAARGQTAYHPYDCMTLTCLCPFFRGYVANGYCILSNGQPLSMAYRKEYRVMTENERNRYHAALNTLKRSGEFDRLGRQHQEVGSGSGAHSGPGFLPWHREYLKRFEIALRMVDPSVSLPYWDSVMDGYLPQPADSMIFSNSFIGETDAWGNVVQGPFAYWPTLEGRGTILRSMAREGRFFSEDQINNIVSQNDVTYVLAYTAPLATCPYPNNFGAVEYAHSNIHLFIGGDMKPPSSSANDPIFFPHHAFVDFLWEMWRQSRQPRWLREQAYTPDVGQCTNWQHFSNAAMRPFPYVVNRDGLSNGYTDVMYRYAPRPACSAQNPNCGSAYLFCDTRGYPHCVAKVKPGGLCRGFESFDVCFASRCWYGRCMQAGRMFRSTDAVKKTLPPPDSSSDSSSNPPRMAPAKPFVAPFVDCFNRHPCCEQWAASEKCGEQVEYMSQFCEVSCEVCRPAFNRTETCADRHTTCAQFARAGMCERGDSGDFMEENCRASCRLCDREKEARCFRGKQLLALPVTTQLVKQIRFSFDQETERKMHMLRLAMRRRA